MELLERFLNYVKYDTQSSEESSTFPSTAKQLILAKDLKEELESMGIETAMDEFGYVIGRIPANIDKKVPTVAFIAHIDTSPDASGENVSPRIIEKYDGKDILLNSQKHIAITTEMFPGMKKFIGHDLVVTDGNTLLGAEDKLGVAEIMTVAEFLTDNPDFEHGEIVICFTPDEEVGRGTEKINVEKINADFAYTLDGGNPAEVAYETFNACKATLTFNGKSVHPGSAKNKLVNAIDLAYEFHNLLPKFMKPELTEGYEGFNHLTNINGQVEKTITKYIIRNHDKHIFNKQIADFKMIADFVNKKYGEGTCKLEIEQQYENMYEILKDKTKIIEIAKAAIKDNGLDPISEPIRGGTDGARLTFMGLPCPNLGTGGHNYHGPYEFASIQEMNLVLKIVKSIITKITEW